MDDEKIYNNLYKLFHKNNTNYDLHILNIYFVFKNIRNGCFISLNLSKNNSNKLDLLLDKLELYYKKYYIIRKDIKYYFYCISKKIIKKELFKHTKHMRSIMRDKSMTTLEIGKFLGYECPGDVSNRNFRKKVYSFNIMYKTYEVNSCKHLYSYICKELDINKIIKQLKLVNKMNRLIDKYLSNKLDGEIVFQLELL